MDLITTNHANAEEVAETLKALGAKARASGSLVITEYHGLEVTIRLCRENNIFAWWQADGEQHVGFCFGSVTEALGLEQGQKRGHGAARVLVHHGLHHRSTSLHVSDFHVERDYDQERKVTGFRVLFRNGRAGIEVSKSWSSLRRMIELVDGAVYLHQETHGADGWYISTSA